MKKRSFKRSAKHLKRTPFRVKKERRYFGNIESEYRGVIYRSRAEMHYAMWLDSEVKRNMLKGWKYEVNTELIINDKKICNVMWDFLLTFKDGHKEFHEMKGYKTAVFRLKEKMFR